MKKEKLQSMVDAHSSLQEMGCSYSSSIALKKCTFASLFSKKDWTRTHTYDNGNVLIYAEYGGTEFTCIYDADEFKLLEEGKEYFEPVEHKELFLGSNQKAVYTVNGQIEVSILVNDGDFSVQIAKDGVILTDEFVEGDKI